MALLRYMDGSEPGNDYTRDLERAAAEIRGDEKWRREFMVMVERDRANRRLGRYTEKVASVRKFRHRFQREDLAEIVSVKATTVGNILSAIDAHPDWDDETIAESIDFD